MLVTSPTSRGARASRPGPLLAFARIGVSFGLSLALTVGLTASASAKGDLDDQRDQVRKELAQTKKEIKADEVAVAEAADQLADSKSRLVKARSALAGAKQKLADAKSADAKVAAELAEAEAAAAAAAKAVVVAQAEVEAQQVLIGRVVRSAYQQQSTLVGWTMVLGSETPGDLAQRLQWSTTLFDSSTSELDRLTAMEESLALARAAKDAAEADLAAKRQASAEHVAAVKKLTAEAADRADDVANLVKANAELKAAAEDDLAASEDEYRALEKEEKSLSAKIRAAERKYRIVNTGGFIRPVDAPAGSPFGLRFHPILQYWRMHWGTDFGAACGAPIRAMADGRVVSAGWTTYGFGNYTIISYGKVRGDYVSSGYAHQSKVVVKAGQKVKQGDIVGYVGTTGLSTGCHLHLQVYRDGTRVNPMKYL